MTQVSGSRQGDYQQAIERLFNEGTVSGLSEVQLLERFAARRDEAAFAALVERHGAMVLGVCRRFLRDPNDVDDAFQAVFLVLVRKAGGLRQKELLGNWLFGVACRVAVRARSTAARRQAKAGSTSGGDRLAVDRRRQADEQPWETLSRDEGRSWLHEEVERLPRRYRQPVVACYFEGRTHEEAATLLGCPLGTVKGRLSRARDLLRKRLERRGLAVSAVALTAQLASPDLRAAVPVPLAHATVRTGLALASAGASLMTTSAISTSVRILTEGVLHAMVVTQIKAVALPLMVVAGGLLTAGATVVAHQDAGESHGRQQGVATQQPEESKAAVDPTSDNQASDETTEPDRAFSTTFAFLSNIQTKQGRARERLREELDDAETENDRERARARHRVRIGTLIEEIDGEAHRDAASRALKELFILHLKKAEGIPEKQESSLTKDAASDAQSQMAGSVGVGNSQGGGGGGDSDGQPSNQQYRLWIARGTAVLARVDESPLNKSVLGALDDPITLRSKENSTLGQMLKQIRESVKTAGGKKIPVYVDPVALQEVERSLDSQVDIDLEDVPLKFSLRLMLKQLGLAYCIRDGVIIISSLEGVQQELMEAQAEQMGLNPEKFPNQFGMGGMGGGMMGGIGGGFGGMGGMGGGQGMM